MVNKKLHCVFTQVWPVIQWVCTNRTKAATLRAWSLTGTVLWALVHRQHTVTDWHTLFCGHWCTGSTLSLTGTHCSVGTGVQAAHCHWLAHCSVGTGVQASHCHWLAHCSVGTGVQATHCHWLAHCSVGTGVQATHCHWLAHCSVGTCVQATHCHWLAHCSVGTGVQAAHDKHCRQWEGGSCVCGHDDDDECAHSSSCLQCWGQLDCGSCQCNPLPPPPTPLSVTSPWVQWRSAYGRRSLLIIQFSNVSQVGTGIARFRLMLQSPYALVFHPKWALLFWRATLWHGQKQLYLCCPHWHWQQFIHVSTSNLTPHASPSSLQAMSCSSLELLQHQQLHLFHLCLFSRHGGTKPVKHHRHCLSLPPKKNTSVSSLKPLVFTTSWQ